MKVLKVTFAVVVAIGPSLSQAMCPDVSRGEKAEDCPWAEITRQIVDAKKECVQELSAQTPLLLKQLKKDGKSRNFIELWGQAKNFDEGAKLTIVDPKILSCLALQWGLAEPTKYTDKQSHTFEIVHAGLQHTYAYLFSNIQTPYGFKRARWVRNDLQMGFGLADSLNPQTTHGTFFSNITYFFASLAFADDARLLLRLRDEAKKTGSVSSELLRFDSRPLEIHSLSEPLAKKDLSVHTTLVKFSHPNPGTKNTHLLIYWTEDQKTHTKKLITGFPVEQGFVDKLLSQKNSKTQTPVNPRYNAWVPGVSENY